MSDVIQRVSRAHSFRCVLLSSAAGLGLAAPHAFAQSSGSLPEPTQSLLDTFIEVVDANTSNPQLRSIADRIVAICPQLTVQFDPNFDPTNPEFDTSVDAGRESGTSQGDLVGRCTAAIEIANGVVPGVAPSSVIDALQQITGEETIALDAIVAGTVRPQTQAIAARVASFSIAPATRLAFRTQWAEPVRIADAADALGYQSDAGNGGFGTESEIGRGFSAFLTGYYFTGDQDPTSLESGFDFDGYSITGGVDKMISDRFVIGVAGGYTDTGIDFDDAAGGLDTEAYSISGYGVANVSDALQASLMTSYSFIDYRSERNISYNDGRDQVDRTAVGETDATQFALTGALHYTFQSGAFSWGPMARFSYLRQHVDGFEETGASGLNLAYNDERSFSVTSGLGLNAAYSASTAAGVITPYVRAEWEHEYDDDARVFSVRYVADTFAETLTEPAAFIVTDAPDRDRARIGAGVAAQFAGGVAGFIDYETVVALDNVSSHTISAGLRVEF